MNGRLFFAACFHPGLSIQPWLCVLHEGHLLSGTPPSLGVPCFIDLSISSLPFSPGGGTLEKLFRTRFHFTVLRLEMKQEQSSQSGIRKQLPLHEYSWNSGVGINLVKSISWAVKTLFKSLFAFILKSHIHSRHWRVNWKVKNHSRRSPFCTLPKADGCILESVSSGKPSAGFVGFSCHCQGALPVGKGSQCMTRACLPVVAMHCFLASVERKGGGTAKKSGSALWEGEGFVDKHWSCLPLAASLYKYAQVKSFFCRIG